MVANDKPIIEILVDAETTFSLKQEKLSDIMDDALVGLDASVLLQFYEIDKGSYKEIGQIYQRLSKAKRLIVPAQAAREFALSRGRKISEVTEKLQRDIDQLCSFSLSDIRFLEDDPLYENVTQEFGKIVEARKSISKNVAKLVENLKDSVGDDPVSNLYRKVFEGSVKELNFEETAFTVELKKRNDQQVPPGFKDAGKNDGGRGDLIIWKTVLQEAAASKSHFIFVTNDNKSDWYVQRSKAAFQLRPELLFEFWQATGGKSVHLTSLSNFVAMSGKTPEIAKASKEAKKAESSVLENSVRVIRRQPRELLQRRIDEISMSIHKKVSSLQSLDGEIKRLTAEIARNSIIGSVDEVVNLTREKNYLEHRRKLVVNDLRKLEDSYDEESVLLSSDPTESLASEP